MKYITLLLFLCQFSVAETVIDARYDNYDGEALVLKLIEDNQWTLAQSLFENEKVSFLKNTPADYYLIKGLFSQQAGATRDSISYFETSLSIRYTPLALEKVILIYSQTSRFDDGLQLLEKHQKNSLGKNLSSEITFLRAAAKNSSQLTRVLIWTEFHLNHSFHFPLFKFYTEALVRNKLLNEATKLVESALEQNRIQSADEVLTLTELFLTEGLEKDVHGILERARLKFPSNDLIKLNLAQVLFKKDLHVSALNLLSELKTDDGVLNVQLELMNLMQVKAYSLFHRMQLQDSNSHLKNWFVYLINNEDWAGLYALHSRYKSATWKNDEFNYAMAYSSQLVEDIAHARTYIELVTSPSLSQKKASLIKSLNL